MNAFDKTPETPFFLTEEDIKKMGGHGDKEPSKELLGQFGDIMEGLTPEEVIFLLDDYFGAVAEFNNAGFVEMSDENKCVVVRPAQAGPIWCEGQTKERLYFEARVRHIQFNDANAVNDANLRHAGVKVYCNNASELCIGSLVDMQFGITVENLAEQVRSFILEADALAHSLLSDRHEIKKSWAVAVQ
jgi:hypothetical protein